MIFDLRLRRLILLLILVVSAPLEAARVEGLYRASVPVTTQEAAERGEAIRTGLSQVLIKVTGSANTTGLPGTAPLLEHATSYLQQFRYEKRAQPSSLPGQPPVETLYLDLSFDPQAINETLRRAGQRVWGAQRPATLVWLAVEQGPERYLVGADADPAVVSVVRDAAARRGMPVLLPLLDLEDRRMVNVADVWGNFTEAVLRASARYQPDAILVGRLYRQSDGRWEAAWTLYQDDDISSWISSGAFSSQVIFQGFDGGADLLVARFAPRVAGVVAGGLRIRVAGVRGLQEYARVASYLGGLEPIRSVELEAVTPGEVLFRIEMEGDSEVLRQTIGLTDMLRPIEPTAPSIAPGDVMATAELAYRLGP